jgi:hypothetical protein
MRCVTNDLLFARMTDRFSGVRRGTAVAPAMWEDSMSAIKDIVAFVDGRPEGACTLEHALRLAMEYGAHLTGAFVWPALANAGPGAYARGTAIRQLLADDEAEVALRETSLREPFELAARNSRLTTDWRSIRQLLTEDLVVHARYADLTIVGRPDSAGLDSIPLDLPQTLVLASGRPVILLPPTPPRGVHRRVLVGLNAAREATRAVADALPFLRRRHSHRAPRGGASGSDVAVTRMQPREVMVS